VSWSFDFIDADGSTGLLVVTRYPWCMMNIVYIMLLIRYVCKKLNIHQVTTLFTHKVFSHIQTTACGATLSIFQNLFQHFIIGLRTCLKYTPYMSGRKMLDMYGQRCILWWKKKEHLLIMAVMGRVALDKGSNCVPLDNGRNGLPFDSDGNGLHSDIWWQAWQTTYWWFTKFSWSKFICWKEHGHMSC